MWCKHRCSREIWVSRPTSCRVGGCHTRHGRRYAAAILAGSGAAQEGDGGDSTEDALDSTASGTLVRKNYRESSPGSTYFSLQSRSASSASRWSSWPIVWWARRAIAPLPMRLQSVADTEPWLGKCRWLPPGFRGDGRHLFLITLRVPPTRCVRDQPGGRGHGRYENPQCRLRHQTRAGTAQTVTAIASVPDERRGLAHFNECG